MNAASSITGRYPNVGPLLLCQAGIPLLDDVGPDVMESIHEGAPITIDGDRVLVGTEVVASGVRQTTATRRRRHRRGAGRTWAPSSSASPRTRSSTSREEIELLSGTLDLPAVGAGSRVATC